MVSLKVLSLLVLLNVCGSVKHQRLSPQNGHDKRHGRFRIIAGRSADISEFPYQASMEHYGQQWCGASIISRRILVTAAHCVQPIKTRIAIPTAIMQIRVGNSISSTGGQTYAINRVIPHERYNEDPSVDEHDIALIVLTNPLKYGAKVQPIELSTEEPDDGEMAWVTGFGRQEPMRRSSQNRHLMAVEIPIMNRQRCIDIHKKYGNVVTEKMICAGFSQGHKDSCKGDSGGPLAVNNKLVGVVAWGIGCGRDGVPGVYTNIAKYLPWIEKKVAEINGEEGKQSRNAQELLYRFLLNKQMMLPTGHKTFGSDTSRVPIEPNHLEWILEQARKLGTSSFPQAQAPNNLVFKNALYPLQENA